MPIIGWLSATFGNKSKKQRRTHKIHTSLLFHPNMMPTNDQQQHNHPWEATKRLLTLPLRLRLNNILPKRRSSLSRTPSTSSSLDDAIWHRMERSSNNHYNSLQQRRRFTESPDALRRSFRRVIKRTGSMHVGAMRAKERRQNLAEKREIYQQRLEEAEFVVKPLAQRAAMGQKRRSDVGIEDGIVLPGDVAESATMGRKRKQGDETVILRQNLVKRRSGDETAILLQNAVIKHGIEVEALDDRTTTNFDRNEFQQSGKENFEVSHQNAGNDGAEDDPTKAQFAAELRQRMIEVLKRQYCGKHHHVLFVDSPDTIRLRAARQGRRWSSEKLKMKKNNEKVRIRKPEIGPRKASIYHQNTTLLSTDHILPIGQLSGNSLVGTRLSQTVEGKEQDRIWLLKRTVRKQQSVERILQLNGDWVQVQIVHLPNEPEGLGFGIVGGHSTGVVIKSVIAGSVADKDQRLRPGDRILQIGQISTQGLNSQQVAALLRQQDTPVVQLTVGRPIQLQDTEADTPMCWTMVTRAALNASSLDEEVQKRLEALASTASTSRCNGIHGMKTQSTEHQQSAVPAINEGTEFPDQLSRLCPEPSVEHNRPSTSNGIFSGDADICGVEAEKQNTGNGQDQQQKTKDEKTNSNPLEKRGESGKRRNRTSRGPSNDNPSCSSSSERRSLRQLQEMALTSFCRDKWLAGKYKIIEVELHRDPKIGLGITVAGYVYRKEEINGVFIKSLVPQSSAHLSGQIQLHDLIVEVNGRSLEGLSHSESVRVLIKSGQKVRLKLVRFEEDTPQAKCLKMLHEQELAAANINSQNQPQQPPAADSASSSTANTGRPAVTATSPVPPALSQHHREQSLVDYKSFWSARFPELDIVVVDVQPDERVEDGGLGIEWQGTVDVCDGNQLCSHHFIESLRKDGPAARTGLLKAGDELLQVNAIPLFVRKVLSRVREEKAEFVRLIFCRNEEKEHHLNLVEPTATEQTLPLAYSLLASMMSSDEHFVKAKSELRICDLTENGHTVLRRTFTPKLKSRSLENLSGLAVWNCVPIVVPLRKDAKGLGFSVADYQDPLHPQEQVIVIRSLVPGGAAQADGRIVPGDRLLFVNGEDLSNSTLQRAVEVLKAAPVDKIVRLGIAKPVPIEQCPLGTVPLISRSERLLAKSHSPRGRRRRRDDLLAAQSHLLNALEPCCSSAGSSQEEIWIGRQSLRSSQRCLNPQLYFPSSGAASTPISPRSPFGTAQSPMQTATASAWTPCSSRSLSPCASPAASSLKGSWSYDIVFLPAHLERHIKVLKGSLPLGLVLDADTDKAINGCVAKNICSKKAVAKDGRIQPGDFLVKINGESLRNVTGAQARAIMKRANLVGAQCNISYITASDAKLWKERFHKIDLHASQQDVNQSAQQMFTEQSRLSPKIYPKFYRSPILDQDSRKPSSILSSSTTPSGIPSPSTEHKPIAKMTSTEKSRKERISMEEALQMSKLFEQFTGGLLKEIFSEAMFELYILWRKQQSDDWSSNAVATSSALNIPQPRSQRSASIATGVPSPPPKPPKGILRRASSSLKKKRSAIKRENADENVPQLLPPSSATKMSPSEESKPSEMPSAETEAIGSRRASASQDAQKQTNFWSEPRCVVLNRRPNETFGISIVGGRVEVSQKGIEVPAANGAGAGNASSVSSTVQGIFIKSVIPDSPAGQCGQLFMGDRLLSVNDVDLRNTTHEHAVQVIKNAENPVRFLVQSLQTLQTFGTSERSSKRPSEASIFSRKDHRPSIGGPVEIDADSAAAMEKAEDDPEQEDVFHYTEKKVRQKYGELPGEPVLIRLANIPSGGLGLILSTRREEGENRPPVIVVGVKTDSPLSLQVGDELLEINGRVLFGLSHQEATEKIRHCCQHSCLSLLVLRKQPQQQQVTTTTTDTESSQGGTLPRERKWTTESECEAGARKIVAEVLEKQGIEKISSDDPSEPLTKEHNNNNEIRPADNRDRAKLSSETVKSAASAPGTLQTTHNNGAGGNEPISRKRSWQMEQQQSQFLQKCPIHVGQETLIEIDKDGKGLGLSIVGGSDTVLGTVVIHEVYPDGAAAIDGRLKPGDQVLEVNSTSLRGITHEQAITLLRRTPAKVRLLVYRDQNLQMSLLDPTQIYNILTIELTKKAGKGLGISIVGRKNEPGVYVSEIVKGGVADSDGRLMQGDQILAVNGQDVANCMQEDVATILKTSTGKVSLKIGRWKLTETAQRVRSAQPPVSSGQQNNNNIGQMPLQQQQNIGADTHQSQQPAQSNSSNTGPDSASTGQPNGTREPPPPAPQPSGGMKLPPPTLQITLHDENNQQQSLMGGGVRTDLSPVSEEDLKSIAETVASEETASAVTTSSSSQRRPLNQLPHAATSSASSSSQQQQPSSSGTNSGGGNSAVSMTTLRMDLKEAGCDGLLIVLKKDEGQQWGMGIGKRPRGILITSLQPGSSAAEKLAIGDRIMAVNGHEVTTQHSAVTYIRSSGNAVALQISRPTKPYISGAGTSS